MGVCIEMKFTRHNVNHLKVNNSVESSTLTMLYTHRSISRTFSSPWKGNPTPISHCSSLSPFFLPWQPPIYFLFIDWPVLNIAYAWNFRVFVLLCLAYCIEHNVFRLHLCCSRCQYFIPFNCWMIFHCRDRPHFVSMHLLLDIWPVSTFWLLWIMQLWTFVYKFLCGHKFSLLCGRH